MTRTAVEFLDLPAGPAEPDAPAASIADQPGAQIEQTHIQIYPTLRDQVLAGLGCALSELGWRALSALPAHRRDEAVAALFDPQQGAALAWARIPVGANDFATDAYSLDDTPGDLGLRHFSLDRDRQSLIPFAREAMRYSPNLRLHASPWSPPAWMKTNHSMVGGGNLIDEPAILDCYAHYLVRFVHAYHDQGLSIERLLPQNEPDVASKYPSCVLPPARMIRLVCDHLAPALAQATTPTQLWAGPFRMVTGLQSHQCAADDRFARAIHGMGFQYSLPEPIGRLRRMHPTLPLMHTESVCHNGDNSWAQAAQLFDDILAYLGAGCDVFTYWNAVLDESATSGWGWRQNSLLTVDRAGRTVRLNPDYHVLRFVARQLPPGARRIEAFSRQRRVLAAQTGDGATVVLLANPAPRPVPAVIQMDPREIQVELPPRSLCAIRIHLPPNP